MWLIVEMQCSLKNTA